MLDKIEKVASWLACMFLIAFMAGVSYELFMMVARMGVDLVQWVFSYG